MRRSTLTLCLCVLVLPAIPSRAQDVPPLPSTPVVLSAPPDLLTAAERRELETWLSEMRKWQKTDKRWHNEPAHDPFGRIVRRPARPDAPPWLDGRCAAITPEDVKTLEGPLGAACRILAGLAEDPAANAIRASTAAARTNAEKLVKDSFLTRVHIDGLWTTTSTDVRMYGLVGSHISLVDVGRVQFFGPPGVIVLSVPTSRGTRELRAGYTWGISVRLTDVRLFAPSKNLTLFLTVTKVWVMGGPFDRLGPGGFDIAGFSLAPRKHR
jgi:hypothetical protein